MTGSRPSDRARHWLTTVDGQQIRHLRRQRGLAREELAGLAGISPRYAGPARTRARSALPYSNAGQARRRTG
jgi:hypothetical protein